MIHVKGSVFFPDFPAPDRLLPRRVAIGSLPGKVSVATDVRGNGKSTLLRRHILQLIESGIHRDNILYLNLADDGLTGCGTKT